VTLTVGSLFSGVGGFELGLERAGMRCIWQSEIDPYASAVLRKHWPWSDKPWRHQKYSSWNRGRGPINTSKGDGTGERVNLPRANSHPTVKPTELMRYLVRLVTPPNAVVLDPFMGSGSTGKAAALEDVRFIGIERDASYYAIAKARIAHAQAQPKQQALELPSAAADPPTNPADQMGFAWE
jgi:DNA modification methylase